MAIHNVDTSGIGRDNPSPLTHDNLDIERRKAHNTISTSYKYQDNTGATSVPTIRMLNSLLVTYDSAGRVSSVYGYIAAVAPYPVIIVAKPGLDVFVDILGIPAPT